MKIAELANGLRYMMTCEQKEIVDFLKKNQIINRYEMNERQQRLAEQMTSIGIIDRVYDEETKTVNYKLFNK